MAEGDKLITGLYDELEEELEQREFDVNPETKRVAKVTRNFQDIERTEITDELAEAEEAQEELVRREIAATRARQEGDRRIANLKSELDRFDEVAQRAGVNTGEAGDGSEDPARAAEPEAGVELD